MQINKKVVKRAIEDEIASFVFTLYIVYIVVQLIAPVQVFDVTTLVHISIGVFGIIGVLFFVNEFRRQKHEQRTK